MKKINLGHVLIGGAVIYFGWKLYQKKK